MHERAQVISWLENKRLGWRIGKGSYSSFHDNIILQHNAKTINVKKKNLFRQLLIVFEGVKPSSETRFSSDYDQIYKEKLLNLV